MIYAGVSNKRCLLTIFIYKEISLHEMLDPVFWKNKKNITSLLSAYFLQRMQRLDLTLKVLITTAADDVFLSPAFLKKSGGTLFLVFRGAWCVARGAWCVVPCF